MNEVELLEAQLAVEREHVREVASWCATLAARGRLGGISDDFTYSCYRYLMFYMRKEEARAAAHLELARAPDPAVRAASERLRAELASTSEAAGSVRAVFAAHPGGAPAASRLDELAKLAERAAGLIESRVALAALTAPHYTLGERRRAAHVDADSILEERRLHVEAARHGTTVIR